MTYPILDFYIFDILEVFDIVSNHDHLIYHSCALISSIEGNEVSANVP